MAHVFQHSTTGVQIFVYHCKDEEQAKRKFLDIVIDNRDWSYIGKKTVLN